MLNKTLLENLEVSVTIALSGHVLFAYYSARLSVGY